MKLSYKDLEELPETPDSDSDLLIRAAEFLHPEAAALAQALTPPQ